MEACSPERRVEILHLLRRLDLDVERSGEERCPGHELLVDGCEALGQHRPVVSTSAVQLHVEQRAEERPECEVRGRCLVLVAAKRDLSHVGAVVAQLLSQSRLADPRFADELDERAETHPYRRDRRTQNCALALAVDEWELVVRSARLRALRSRTELAEDERLDGPALAFEHGWLEPGG